jgi:hypothetical protein
VRYVTDLAGNPKTAYPTRQLWDVKKVKGFNVVAQVATAAAVVAFTAAFESEAEAAYESGARAREAFDASTWYESIVPWLNPSFILDIVLSSPSSNRPLPEYREMRQAADRVVSRLSKSGLQFSAEEEAALRSATIDVFEKSFDLGVQAIPQEHRGRYVRTPDGLTTDTESGRSWFGPGPKY